MRFFFLLSLLIGTVLNLSTVEVAPRIDVQEQTGKNHFDTLQYLQHAILDKKDLYIHKPFDVLLNDLKINIRSCLPSITVDNKLISPGITLSFLSKHEDDIRFYNKQKMTSLYITWESTVLIKDADHLSKKNAFEWTQDEKEFYNKYFVKNIELVKLFY